MGCHSSKLFQSICQCFRIVVFFSIGPCRPLTYAKPSGTNSETGTCRGNFFTLFKHSKDLVMSSHVYLVRLCPQLERTCANVPSAERPTVPHLLPPASFQRARLAGVGNFLYVAPSINLSCALSNAHNRAFTRDENRPNE